MELRKICGQSCMLEEVAIEDVLPTDWVEMGPGAYAHPGAPDATARLRQVADMGCRLVPVWRLAPSEAGTLSAEEVQRCRCPSNLESDPSGRDAHAPGAKLDAGKVRLALVLDGFARALWEVGRVGTFGAAKYSDNGWMQVPGGIARYRDALARHESKVAQGEVLDPDSGLLHKAHAAWNALADLELTLREMEEE